MRKVKIIITKTLSDGTKEIKEFERDVTIENHVVSNEVHDFITEHIGETNA